jgi:hypothetical protein
MGTRDSANFGTFNCAKYVAPFFDKLLPYDSSKTTRSYHP